jgi:uncharacterized protein YjbJ (UPF0337 family)
LERRRDWSVAPAVHKESSGDWYRVEGNWKQAKGKVKEQWGKLTDDDLDVIDGKQDQLEGRLQERYGYAKDQARKEVNDWYDRQSWVRLHKEAPRKRDFSLHGGLDATI